MRLRLLVALPVVLAGVGVLAWPSPSVAPSQRPAAPRVSRPALPPTEGFGTDTYEADNKTRRKEYIRERHRAAPGVDWLQIERENGRKLTERRRGPPPPGPQVWTERGSDNQAGRMHVGRLSTSGEFLYAGSSLGGVWRGDPDGGGWTPIGDDLYGGAHWLLALPGDGGTDVVLAATDWGRLYRTTDDGESWEMAETWPEATELRRLLVDGDGVVWAVSGNYGGYTLSRSLDQGATFEAVYDLGTDPGDLWAPRTGPGALYLLDGDDLRVSTDGGDTWETRPGPFTSTGAGYLVGSEAGAPTLYGVWSRNNSWLLARSDDAGLTWTELGGLSDFWGALDASSVDPLLFAWGGMEMWISEDGGATSARPNEWWEYYDAVEDTLHADMMGIDATPDGLGGETWYVATDGGLYRSRDLLTTFENLSLSGLRVSQYYSTLTSSADPSHVHAGAQDQGYQVTQGMTQDDDLLEFDQIISGDYGHLTSSDGSHDWVYSVYPGIILVVSNEENPSYDYLYFPSGEGTLWLPPIYADPEDPEAFFFGGTRLYRYSRANRGWNTEVWSTQDFAESDYEYISAIVASPLDPQRMWIATSLGRVFTSTDKGVSWDASAEQVPQSHYFYGTALVASKLDVDTVYAAGSGYSGPAVYRSDDGGERWERYAEGLPETLVYSLVEAADGTLVAGTETGAWRRDPGSAEWVDISGGVAPVTLYWSAELLADGSTVRFGTYGRGIWDYSLAVADGCDAGEDADGDGAECAADCDDGDGGRAPGLAEVCGDEVDQDCNGADAACDEAEPGAEPPTEAKAPGGCGCGTGTVPGALAMGLGLALVAARRRADRK